MKISKVSLVALFAGLLSLSGMATAEAIRFVMKETLTTEAGHKVFRQTVKDNGLQIVSPQLAAVEYKDLKDYQISVHTPGWAAVVCKQVFPGLEQAKVATCATLFIESNNLPAVLVDLDVLFARAEAKGFLGLIMPTEAEINRGIANAAKVPSVPTQAAASSASQAPAEVAIASPAARARAAEQRSDLVTTKILQAKMDGLSQRIARVVKNESEGYATASAVAIVKTKVDELQAEIKAQSAKIDSQSELVETLDKTSIELNKAVGLLKTSDKTSTDQLTALQKLLEDKSVQFGHDLGEMEARINAGMKQEVTTQVDAAKGEILNEVDAKVKAEVEKQLQGVETMTPDAVMSIVGEEIEKEKGVFAGISILTGRTAVEIVFSALLFIGLLVCLHSFMNRRKTTKLDNEMSSMISFDLSLVSPEKVATLKGIGDSITVPVTFLRGSRRQIDLIVTPYGASEGNVVINGALRQEGKKTPLQAGLNNVVDAIKKAAGRNCLPGVMA